MLSHRKVYARAVSRGAIDLCKQRQRQTGTKTTASDAYEISPVSSVLWLLWSSQVILFVKQSQDFTLTENRVVFSVKTFHLIHHINMVSCKRDNQKTWK